MAPSSRTLCDIEAGQADGAQAQKIRAAIQPALPMRDRLQMYMMMPGATPKLTRSARLSSCAPKRLSAPSMRAARPSSMSKIMAKITKVTAVVHSLSQREADGGDAAAQAPAR